MKHIENLTANGPRSIVDSEENQAALDYITDTLDSFGVVNEDTTDKPAYLVQPFVAKDTDYQNWYLKNIIVHIPANSDTPTGEAVMFMSHTDSVPMGDGASDDGVPVSVMLEAVNYYMNKLDNGYTMSNDLVFCFVNGEEYGLYGSEAFMNGFDGFDNIVDRIKFGANLESRGTSGTLIMFETSANNYSTVKLFSEINKSVFTCSIATMVYDMMPNGTDFSNFKEAYQGLNFANIMGGENYHTQNDSYENVGDVYVSQQAQVVDSLIDRLANYELTRLYDADESAVFFSYLNITTLVYNTPVATVLGIILVVMMLLNALLSLKKRNFIRTLRSLGAVGIGLVVSALVTYVCYYLFQLIAALAGVIDIHAVGTITYSNTYIIVGIGFVALAVTVLTSRFAVKHFKVTYRDLCRAFAYIHAFFGAVLTFALPDASYLFVFSGLMLMICELLATCVKSAEGYRFEILATALYMPIVIPVIVLAASALGLTMAYVYGLVFAIAIFPIGLYAASVCDLACEGSKLKLAPVAVSIISLAVAFALFLAVSLTRPNANVNLQGKQSLATLPYDDALVYAVGADGDAEYRVYDLNAYRSLKKYAPDMSYSGEYYVGEGSEVNVEYAVLSSVKDSILDVSKVRDDTIVYLTFNNIKAESFTVDDGATSNTYEFTEEDTYGMTIHSNCTVTVSGGSADVEYYEVLRDYTPLIPDGYSNNEKLHFNLWLTNEFVLGE